jgi:hypothetical protein
MSYEEAPVTAAPTKTLAELEAEAKAHAADAASQPIVTQTVPQAAPLGPTQTPSANPEADAALKDAMSAYDTTPLDNTRSEDIGAQPFPPIEHAAPLSNGPTPEIKPHSGPMLPPMPDFSTLPDMPGEAPQPYQQPPAGQSMPPSATPPPAPGQQGVNDPTQFQIPGQS